MEQACVRFPCLKEMEQWLGVFRHVTLVTQRISEFAPSEGGP